MDSLAGPPFRSHVRHWSRYKKIYYYYYYDD